MHHKVAVLLHQGHKAAVGGEQVVARLQPLAWQQHIGGLAVLQRISHHRATGGIAKGGDQIHRQLFVAWRPGLHKVEEGSSRVGSQLFQHTFHQFEVGLADKGCIPGLGIEGGELIFQAAAECGQGCGEVGVARIWRGETSQPLVKQLAHVDQAYPGGHCAQAGLVTGICHGQQGWRAVVGSHRRCANRLKRFAFEVP